MAYNDPEVGDRMAGIQTMEGDGPPSNYLGRHGDLTGAYIAAHARHNGVSDDAGNDTSYGAGIGGETDSAFSTRPYNSSDAATGNESGYGKGIGSPVPMVSYSGGGDDQPDTGMSGGKPIA
jgi:hypothetical protein